MSLTLHWQDKVEAETEKKAEMKSSEEPTNMTSMSRHNF